MVCVKGKISVIRLYLIGAEFLFKIGDDILFGNGGSDDLEFQFLFRYVIQHIGSRKHPIMRTGDLGSISIFSRDILPRSVGQFYIYLALPLYSRSVRGRMCGNTDFPPRPNTVFTGIGNGDGRSRLVFRDELHLEGDLLFDIGKFASDQSHR